MTTAKLNIPLPNRGINIAVPPEFIDAREATRAVNWMVEDGVLRKRNGARALGQNLGERVMAYAQLLSGLNVYVLRFGTANVQLLNQPSNAWIDVTGALLTGNADDVFSFAFPHISAQRVLAFTNGIDAPRYYDGLNNTANLGGSPPICRHMISYGSYLLIGYTTESGVTYPFRLRWSDTGNPQVWSGGNSGVRDLIDDGRDITGFGLYGRFFTIHKESAIYVGYLANSTDIFTIERIETGVGACAENTIANLPTGDQIFLARDGVRIFNGSTAPLVNSNLQRKIRDQMNPQYMRRSVGRVIPDKSEYWVTVPLGSSENPTTTFIYNYEEGYLYEHERAGLSTLGLYTSTSELTFGDLDITFGEANFRFGDVFFTSLAQIPMFGYADGSSTEQGLSQSDNGTAIDAAYETKDFTAQDFQLPDFGQNMRWSGLRLWAKGGSLSVSYSTDSGSTWSNPQDVVLPSDYAADGTPVYFDEVSPKIRFRFRNQETDETPYLKKYWPRAVPREIPV